MNTHFSSPLMLGFICLLLWYGCGEPVPVAAPQRQPNPFLSFPEVHHVLDEEAKFRLYYWVASLQCNRIVLTDTLVQQPSMDFVPLLSCRLKLYEAFIGEDSLLTLRYLWICADSMTVAMAPNVCTGVLFKGNKCVGIAKSSYWLNVDDSYVFDPAMQPLLKDCLARRKEQLDPWFLAELACRGLMP
jgi:hypothetical protein